jgi:hypothetical protein
MEQSVIFLRFISTIFQLTFLLNIYFIQKTNSILDIKILIKSQAIIPLLL